MTDRLAELSRAGVSIWLDDLSRDRLTSGSLASLVARDHVAGVTRLVAPGVVNTMPEATLRAVADHGEVPADSVRAHYSDGRQVLTELAAVGCRLRRRHRRPWSSAAWNCSTRSWRELSDQLAAKLRNPCHS